MTTALDAPSAATPPRAPGRRVDLLVALTVCLLGATVVTGVQLGRIYTLQTDNPAAFVPVVVTVGLGIVTGVVVLVGAILRWVDDGLPAAVRRWRVPAGAFVLAALTLAATGVVVERPLPRQHHVAMPDTRAGPTAVVQAYVHALDAHDDKTARALTVPGSPAEEPVNNPYVHVSLTRLSDVQAYTAAENDCCGAPVVDVRTMQRATWRDGGEVTPDGDYEWGYELVRFGPDHAWRIYGEGTG